MTSGKLTGSNTQHGVGGWKSHNNAYALGFDLAGGSSWSGSDYEKYLPYIKDWYAQKGYDVRLEKPGQGKSTGWHYDIKPTKDIRPEGAEENIRDYERMQATKSMQEMMDINAIISKLPKEAKEKYAELLEKKSKGNTEAVNTAEVLKEALGVHKSDVLQGNPWVVDTKDGGSVLLLDPTGNEAFTQQATQALANGGA